jgi:hypothetical protein
MKCCLSGATIAQSIAAALSDPEPLWITLPSRDEEVPDELRRAKGRRAGIDGKVLLLHAAATARRAAALQATTLLVVDPFDDDTAAMWRERYGFRASVDARRPRRLWLPLDAID